MSVTEQATCSYRDCVAEYQVGSDVAVRSARAGLGGSIAAGASAGHRCSVDRSASTRRGGNDANSQLVCEGRLHGGWRNQDVAAFFITLLRTDFLQTNAWVQVILLPLDGRKLAAATTIGNKIACKKFKQNCSFGRQSKQFCVLFDTAANLRVAFLRKRSMDL